MFSGRDECLGVVDYSATSTRRVGAKQPEYSYVALACTRNRRLATTAALREVDSDRDPNKTKPSRVLHSDVTRSPHYISGTSS